MVRKALRQLFTGLLPKAAPAVQHRRFIDLAFQEAKDSPHPKVKVGAVITSPDGKRILAAAYNGFADGIKCTPERLRDGNRSYWIMCAEKRALNFARRRLQQAGLSSLKGCRLYSTLDPCHTCADDLICAGIADIYVPDAAHQHHPKLKEKWLKSIRVGAAKLKEAKLPVHKLARGEGVAAKPKQPQRKPRY